MDQTPLLDAMRTTKTRAAAAAMADANVTLTADQANRNGLIVLTGTLMASRILTLLANHRRLAIRNATSGGQEVRAKYAGAGAEVTIVPGATVLVQGNDSDLFGVGGGAGALNDLTDVSVGAAAPGDVLRFDGAQWGIRGGRHLPADAAAVPRRAGAANHQLQRLDDRHLYSDPLAEHHLRQ
jgi:hypothetical protein